MVGLSAEQCACLGDLLTSKHSCVLPARLPCLSISSLCFLLAPLAQHPDLLRRWKAALHAACEAVSVARGITPVNWNDLSQKVLEPAIRKPLHIHFVITCLDFSWNIDSLVAVRPLFPPLNHLPLMAILCLALSLNVGRAIAVLALGARPFLKHRSSSVFSMLSECWLSFHMAAAS